MAEEKSQASAPVSPESARMDRLEGLMVSVVQSLTVVADRLKEPLKEPSKVDVFDPAAEIERITRNAKMVQETLKIMIDEAYADDRRLSAELPMGAKQFDIHIEAVGSSSGEVKVRNPLRRVGGRDRYEAEQKYLSYYGILSIAPPSTLVVNEVSTSAA